MVLIKVSTSTMNSRVNIRVIYFDAKKNHVQNSLI